MELIALFTIMGIGIFSVVVYIFTLKYLGTMFDNKIKVLVQNMIYQMREKEERGKNGRIEKKD